VDDIVRGLIALGASASANCRPCLEHHLGRARDAGASEQDIAAAVEIGMQVNEGAARQTQAFITTLFDREPVPRR
jgi:AhpD family alkylhydroperoxidase